jgi:hypothetical protein
MYARVPNSLKKRRSGRSEPHGYRLAVRRVGICVFLGLLAPTVVGVGTASAHLCTYAAQIKVGVPQQTISIGVTVEDVTVPDVEVEVPKTLHIDRVDPAPGFQSTVAGRNVRFRGGPIQPFTCQYFSLGVTAKAKGAFVIPVTQRTADGKVVVQTKADPGVVPNPRLVQVVYAGVAPPPSPTGSSSSTSPLLYVGVGIIALALVALLIGGIRSWRDRGLDDEEDEEDDDLDARVEAFKRQAQDRATKG